MGGWVGGWVGGIVSGWVGVFVCVCQKGFVLGNNSGLIIL